MNDRRSFLGQLGAVAAALAANPDRLRGATPSANGAWDTSWIEHVASARYRVVFNASEVSDGAVRSYAATFLDDFHTVHDTTDPQTRAVIVFRRLGIPMALNDRVWERYGIGEDIKVKDPDTHAPARRNVFWRPSRGASPWESKLALEALQGRGVISLVCSEALGNWASGAAERLKRDPEKVKTEWRENLIPGAILVPTGIYALIRAQNAGCAYMQGT